MVDNVCKKVSIKIWRMSVSDMEEDFGDNYGGFGYS